MALFESAGDVIPSESLNNMLALVANPDSGSDEVGAGTISCCFYI